MAINDHYIQLEIKTASREQQDILVARLSEVGYQFEEERMLLKAFIASEAFDQAELDLISSSENIIYSKSTITQRNWNEEWEAGFQPVEIEHFCRIRAAFHDRAEGFEYDLVITPRMSFGTGHHATTYMMVKAMQQVQIKAKNVFDFGTGTGILAILSVKMGAGSVVAIDNDDWSIENAVVNFKENGVENILLEKADTINLYHKFDVILANINKNIILKNLPGLKQHLVPGGVVLLSGLLENDKEAVLRVAEEEDLRLLFFLERDSWICLCLH